MGQPRQLAKFFFVTINSLSIIKKIVTQDYCHSTSATYWLNSFFQCKHFQIVFNKNHKSFLFSLHMDSDAVNISRFKSYHHYLDSLIAAEDIRYLQDGELARLIGQ